MFSFNYKWHEDSGHAWLEVPKQDVIDSGLDFSGYSYMKGNFVFLEEDCDAPKFLRWKYGDDRDSHPTFSTSFVNGESVIRSYQRYDRNECLINQ